ncbi:purine and uridine phosphorylase [Trichoderma citrinoviride]|uniref:Purine and uridine phosphorylase n=1 Tax=Trichoderma citrinoviride TaxID=58853 RepID=A0A2T4B2X3_9HYPO|nr:purine and uridine phosphorylase [Trichoderma citrinoviride]PTB63677.1 purine and uridine phosphorylase [Trichoderma citrinoviride]
MLPRESFTIGWICALLEEYEAACVMLDEELEGPDLAEPDDSNTYCFGRIGEHRIVIGCLPSGRYGTSSAARVAQDMRRSFPRLRFGLMVGIGGGAPTSEHDIRLGDVVVSVPNGTLGGVVQFDLGKRVDGEFQRVGHLNAPPTELLGALPEVKRRHNYPGKYGGVDEHLRRFDDDPRFHRPDLDRLFRTESKHSGGKTCADCDPDGVVDRQPRAASARAIEVFYGTIASSNSVMKDAVQRDTYAHDPELNVLCFEMEAAGLMNDFPCLVIRGICDYSDMHKNDDWHYYAAATAAAYARELLCVIKPTRVAQMREWVVRWNV